MDMFDEFSEMFEGGEEKRNRKYKNTGDLPSNDYNEKQGYQRDNDHERYGKFNEFTQQKHDKGFHSEFSDIIKANPFVGRILKSKALMATTAILAVVALVVLVVVMIPLLGQFLNYLNKGGLKGILDTIQPLLNKGGD
jgi:hypothetical protein